MKKIITMLALTASAATFAAPTQWLTVDNDVLAQIQPKLNKSVQSLYSAHGATVVKMNQDEVEALSGAIHDELHRCGGFMTHDSYEEARATLDHQSDSVFAQKAIFADYSIDQGSIVVPAVAAVSEISIRDMIVSLSNFNSRHYKSETGVKSSEFIRDTWADLSKHRSDVKVELFSHPKWPQSSIIMTIEGSEKSDEIVIVGGHADSITAGIFGGGSPTARSPGADDNASGIATITEVIKVLMAQNYKPRRTVQFMGYSAEEVGLLGSKEIANKYKADGKKVVGVMQLDMTLNKGTADKDIVMMSDFTNAAQNDFLGKLIDQYVKVSWGYSRCGYGCSDHASWTGAGYPASMPFESTMEDINKKIHTANDTLQTAGGDAKHSAKFAKLATSFVVELAN